MSVFVSVTKKTRGQNSREVTFNAIGKYITKTVQREKDEQGNDLGKDSEGKLITRAEDIQVFETEGVVTSIDALLEVFGGDEQRMIDAAVIGYNKLAYAAEADKDELDELLASQNLDDDTRDAFKRAVRQVMKVTGLGIIDAVDVLMKNRKPKE